MKKTVFSLKAWHFCLLCVCLMTLTLAIDWMELKQSPEQFNSCFVEMNDEIHVSTVSSNLYCVLFHDGESDLHRKMEYNISELATGQLSDAYFYKVNIKDNEQVCYDFRLSGVPSLLVFKDGQEMNRIMGVVSTSNLQKIFDKINP